MPSAKVSEALERMRRPPGTRLDAALAREMAVREGIKAVLTGQVARLGGGFLLSAQLVSPASGDVLAAYRETAPDSTQVIAAIDRLSARLRERIGESLRSVRSEPPLTQVTTRSLAALHKYIEGQLAGDAEGDTSRRSPARGGCRARHRVRHRLADARRLSTAILGDREQGVAALTKAIAARGPADREEREHTRAIYYEFVTGEYDRAVAIYRISLKRYPHDSLAARTTWRDAYYLLHQYERAESIWRAELDTIHPWHPQLNLATGLMALAVEPRPNGWSSGRQAVPFTKSWGTRFVCDSTPTTTRPPMPAHGTSSSATPRLRKTEPRPTGFWRYRHGARTTRRGPAVPP